MSVRMALAKLAACAAGGAVLGGGAVHVSEAPSAAEMHHVKPIKVKQVKARHYAKVVRPVQRMRRVVKTTVTKTCQAPQQQMAMMPVPYMPPAPPQQMGGGGGGAVPVVIGGGGIGGFGGGFFGGFFGGGGAGAGAVSGPATTRPPG